MKTIPVLGIPYYNRPDLLERCLASIDCHVDQLVIVDQGPVPLGDEFVWRMVLQTPYLHQVNRIVHPNAGVAGAWNEILKLFPSAWWLLVNNDIQFGGGDLARLAAALEGNEGKHGVLYGNHGASCFAITDACIERVGLFDENIFPAYLEDCDYSYRMKLLGVPALNMPGMLAIHGDGIQPSDTTKGSRTIMSDPDLRRRNGVTHGNNFEYYRAKWGGNNGEEVYRTPFNNPWVPVWAWRFDPTQRARQMRALKS